MNFGMPKKIKSQKQAFSGLFGFQKKSHHCEKKIFGEQITEAVVEFFGYLVKDNADYG